MGRVLQDATNTEAADDDDEIVVDEDDDDGGDDDDDDEYVDRVRSAVATRGIGGRSPLRVSSSLSSTP